MTLGDTVLIETPPILATISDGLISSVFPRVVLISVLNQNAESF